MEVTKKEKLIQIIANGVVAVTLLAMLVHFPTTGPVWPVWMIIIVSLAAAAYWIARGKVMTRWEHEFAQALEFAVLVFFWAASQLLGNGPVYGVIAFAIAVAWAVRAVRKYKER